MPAGFKYDLNPIERQMPEMCRFETVYRYSGGFNLDISNLTGVAQIPPLTPLVLDFVKRTAKAVLNVEVAEKITAGSTSLKIKKNSLAYVGMHIGNGTMVVQLKLSTKVMRNMIPLLWPLRQRLPQKRMRYCLKLLPQPVKRQKQQQQL